MHYELISDDEYGKLPADDEQCFVEFESICRRSMTQMIDQQDSSNDFERAVREQYMTAVTSVAKECLIPNVEYIPDPDINFYQSFSIFSLAVQGEVARIRIRGRGNRDSLSVLLTSSTKTKIEHYIDRIRNILERSDLSPKLKKRLNGKLDDLAAELSKQRLSFGKTMAILVSVVTSISGAVTIAADGQSAVSHIMHLIGQDKETEDEAARRLTPPPKALPAPPAKAPRVHHASITQTLDDDIPF